MSTRAPDRQQHGAAATEAAEAFIGLRQTIALLGEELAGFRRRAQSSEARVRELERELKRAEERARKAEAFAAAPLAPEHRSAREAELAQENEKLRQRLGDASRRMHVLVDRLRFTREQEAR